MTREDFVLLLKTLRLDADLMINRRPELENTAVFKFYYSVYVTLYDYIGDVLILVENKRFVSLPIIIRSFIDSYADFAMVVKDSKKLDNLLLRDLEDKKSALEIKLEPIYNQISPGRVDVRKTVKDLLIITEAEIQNLKLRSIKVLTIKERYELADLSDYYKTLYKRLSAEAHNSLTAYVNRHFAQTSKATASIRYDQEGSEDDLVWALVTLTEFYFRFLILFSRAQNWKTEKLKFEQQHKDFTKMIGFQDSEEFITVNS